MFPFFLAIFCVLSTSFVNTLLRFTVLLHFAGWFAEFGGRLWWLALSGRWVCPDPICCRWSLCPLQHGGNQGLPPEHYLSRKLDRNRLFFCRRNWKKPRTRWKRTLKASRPSVRASKPWWAIWRHSCTPSSGIPSTWKPKRNNYSKELSPKQ